MKRIILLSDGTGNTPNKVWRSNVWRVFQSLDRTSAEQHPIYDDGVGTSSFLPFALIGGMFGWGLKRNVISLYKFAARNYETKADEIFAFGFSRGAFTINTVINLIAHQGLIEYRSEADCDWRAKAAYRAYRRARAKSLLRLEYIVYAIRDFVIAPLLWRGRQYSKDDNRQGVRIKFVGLWDTVGAYGLPVESMTRAISKWYWPLDLPNRELPEIVDRACHALSLDDERRTFHPILWNERNESVKAGQGGKRYIQDERISQVWFAGSHANVGGGYPDNSLAHVSLCWMLEEAGKCGLKFNKAPKADPDTEKNFRSIEDKDGRVYDSRKGIRGYYRYAPRKLIELTHMRFSSQPGDEVEIDRPKIHESVFDRIFRKVHFYGPIGIPATYRIVGYDGQITQHQEKYEGEEKAKERAKQQERVWDLVWIRSVLNYTIMGALLYVALYPLLTRFSPEDEYSSPLRPISDLVRLAGAFLPDAFTIWVNAYARSPGFFFVLMVVIFIMYRVNSTTKVKITDEMCDLWLGGAREYTPGLLHTLRTESYLHSDKADSG